MEHEMAAAWERRWVFRALPAVAVGAALVLSLAAGSFEIMTWGLLFAAFALLWDLAFVERGRALARARPPSL